MKFKIGDEVKVISGKPDYYNEHRIGDIGFVHHISKEKINLPIHVNFNGSICCFKPEQITHTSLNLK